MSLQKIDSADYDQLLARCKPLVASATQHARNYVRDYWQLGKELLEIPTKYGDGVMLRLARDLNKSKSELYRYIQFAEKEADFEAFSARFSHVRQFETGLPPWREIVKGLPEPRKSTSLPTKSPTPSQLPSNPAATPDEIRRAYAPERAPLPTSESKPALLFREILTWLQIPHVSEKELQVSTDRGPRTYIADFFVNHRILEVDSELHDLDRDKQRDQDLMKGLGFKTERFLDSDITITHKTLLRLREIAVVEQVTAT